MNKLRMLSVSVVLAMLFTFANEEASAQTDAQFLNTFAADTRKTLPETIGDVEFTDATTYCPAGCQRNYATSLLGITGWTPRLAKQSVSIGQLELSVKPQMLQDYCSSDAKQRNIGVAVYIYDMYKAYIGFFSVMPSDCGVNATPNVAPNTSQSTPTAASQAASPNAQFLNSFAADTRKTLPTTIGDVEFTDATTYCPVGCQRNYATSVLGITGWTPRLAKQNVAIGQLEQTVKPQMLKDYCTSPAKQRNIGAAVYVYDMYKAYIGVFSITPGDCAASVTPNVTPNTSGTSVEDQYWDAVKNSSRVGDFQAYLNSYPYGQYASIARLRLNQLGGSVNSGSAPTPVSPGNSNPLPSGSAASTVEQQYWDAVRTSTRPSDFQDYLNNYPNGQYAPIARLRINQLGGSVSSVSAPTPVLPGANSGSPVPSATSTVEQQYWDAVKSSSRIEDFQNYLRDYPNGQFVPIARLKISQLGGNAPTNPPVNATAEDQYWTNISNSQRPQDFQGYLYNYPNGTYSSLARLRINQLGGNTTQSSPVVSAVEEQYWNNVRNSQRPQDFQDYLNTYPNGQYVLVARLRINQLTTATPPNTVTSPPRQQTVAEILASAEYGSISEILPLRRVFLAATDLDSRDIILKELQALPKLIVVGRKEDADFFILFALTDQATGANVGANSNPANQTYLGELLVVAPRAGTNGETIPRILWRTKKTQSFDPTGLTFNRPPAVNAAREFVKELKKINY